METSGTYDLLVLGGGPGRYTAAIRRVQLGVRVAPVERDEFSLSASGIPLAKKIIRNTTMAEAREIAQSVLSFGSPGESRQYLKAALQEIVARRNPD